VCRFARWALRSRSPAVIFGRLLLREEAGARSTPPTVNGIKVALRLSPPPDLAPRISGAAPALRPARPCRPVADNHGPPPGPIASPPSDPQPPPRPPCFFGLPTPPPAPPLRPQLCSRPHVLKPSLEHLDKSQAFRASSDEPPFACPPYHHAVNDSQSIEPKSQPGWKPGNQGNQETAAEI
jgi:hypothetical protein